MKLHEVIKTAMVEFSNEFPGVEKTEANDNGCVYVYLKKGKGVPDGYFSQILFRFDLTVCRVDDEKEGVRITFKKV